MIDGILRQLGDDCCNLYILNYVLFWRPEEQRQEARGAKQVHEHYKEHQLAQKCPRLKVNKEPAHRVLPADHPLRAYIV